MAAEKIKFSKLVEWVDSYSKNALERETKNVVINLDDIKELVKYCDEHSKKDKINSIRFYLVRQNEKDRGRDIVFDDQTQISIIGVPVIDYKDNEFDVNNKLIEHKGGYDLKEGDDIFSIYPFHVSHEHSGLCPYNCRGSLNSDLNQLP